MSQAKVSRHQDLMRYLQKERSKIWDPKKNFYFNSPLPLSLKLHYKIFTKKKQSYQGCYLKLKYCQTFLQFTLFCVQMGLSGAT